MKKVVPKMKQFKIKYKNADGTIEEDVIDAIDTDEARAFGQSLARVRGAIILSINAAL
jgi:hypothetical protein